MFSITLKLVDMLITYRFFKLVTLVEDTVIFAIDSEAADLTFTM